MSGKPIQEGKYRYIMSQDKHRPEKSKRYSKDRGKSKEK